MISMPDDRLIHKRMGRSQKVSGLNDLEFRVWMQYELSSDDFGVLRMAPISIQGDNAALEKRPARLIQRALEALVTVGLLLRFEHQGETYVCQHDWQNWQRVRYPRPTMHPIPPPSILAKCTPETRELFQRRPGNPSEEPPESSGNNSEGSPSHARARMATANGSRLTATANGSARFRGNGLGSGVMAGALPREHLRHSFCGRVCVPEFLHGEFRQKLGGEPDSADHRLRAFYELALSEIPNETPIGDDPIKFWRAHFAAAFGSVAPKNVNHPLGQSMFQPGTSAAELAAGVLEDLERDRQKAAK
jgi:hypothetical protein